MGKKNDSQPVLEIVKTERKPRYSVLTVRVAAGLVFDAFTVLTGSVPAGTPFTTKTLASGRAILTIGKVASGKPKLSEAEKLARKAEREKINRTAKTIRKLMQTDSRVARFAETLANGHKLSPTEIAELIAAVS